MPKLKRASHYIYICEFFFSATHRAICGKKKACRATARMGVHNVVDVSINVISDDYKGLRKVFSASNYVFAFFSL